MAMQSRILRPAGAAILAPVVLAALASNPAAADVAVIEPSQDNTLYESSGGFKSNGQGNYCFAGKTNLDELRRGLLEFDLSAQVPAGSTVTGVELSLFVSKASNTLPKPFGLFRAQAEWGEGPSLATGEEGAGGPVQAGDASWTKRVHPDLPWNSAGGDFDPTPVALITVGDTGFYSFPTSSDLVAAVQAWVDDADQNHGWVVRGDEFGGDSAKRFNSRQHPDPARRPLLTVFFDPPACPSSLAASETVRVGVPANPPALTPGQTSGPLLGAVWDPRIDHGSFAPDAVLDLAFGSALALNLPIGDAGTLLCDPVGALLFEAPAPGAPFAVAIPDDCGLLGAPICVQGLSITAAGQVALTNALDVVLGDS